MKRMLIVSSILVLLSFATVAEAQSQFFVYGGQAWQQTATGFIVAAGFNMKWCKADANLHPTTSCAAGIVGGTGLFNIDIPTNYGEGYYYPYLWKDDISWGSSTYPFAYPVYLIFTPFGNQVGGQIYSTPRALRPNAVYPASKSDSVNVPVSFTLQWSDGLDASRRSSSWPVTYDIYASGNEFPENLVFSNIPCNGVGTCNIAVSGLVYTTRYQWRVVAKMHSQPNITWTGLDPTFLTNSALFKFSTTWDPSIPVHNILTVNGNYLRASQGGGAAFDATGSANTYETQFQVGGTTVNSGDSVNIRTNVNYFASAVNGGGAGVNAIPKWNMGYETWTIIRIAGPGPISHGDQVAFVSYTGYYMSADQGGGGVVTADRTAIGPWETFIFN